MRRSEYAKLFRAVHHDLLDKKDAGTLYVAGNPEAKNRIVFIPGYPCDQTSFFGIAAKFVQDSEDFFVGCTCLPEYDRVGTLGLEPLKQDGYNWEEQLSCFIQAIQKLEKLCGGRDAKLTVACHDWGTASGFAYSNKIGCDKLVCFDVIPSYTPGSLYDRVVHTLYQKQLALSFFLWRYVNKFLGTIVFMFTIIVNFGLLRRWLLPTGLMDSTPGKGPGLKPKAISAFHSYPYWYQATDLSSDKVASLISLKKSLSKNPILYLYGASKNTMFHNEQQLKMIENANNGSKVVRVENSAHWLYKQQTELCFKTTRDFILQGNQREKNSQVEKSRVSHPDKPRSDQDSKL